MFAALPYGAQPGDTGEFMVGRIAVTPVLLESDGSIDQNLYNWNQSQIDQVMGNLREGLDWWVNLLETKTTVHDIEWVIDDRFAVTPAPTSYEPINRVSNDYRFWVREFLTDQGFNQTGQIDSDMRMFNDAQRQRLNTDWSFTIFVANSHFDEDGLFAQGGSFRRAFAFAGGLYFVTPSTRPASTYTHETGHMFWARDEYAGGGSYTQRRGYYNTQNWNAADNPTPGFVQQPSIMAAGSILDQAYSQLTSAASTLEQLGWRDSDNDGIFDVLDVPIQLDGQGFFDSTNKLYRFNGYAMVGTLPNLNSAGLRNDITLNQIARLEYRLDGGVWQTAQTINAYTASIDLQIPVLESTQQIEIRAVGDITGIESPIFVSDADRPNITNNSGISGVVWIDDNLNQTWEASETGKSDWTVELVDNQGVPLSLQTHVDPNVFAPGELPTNFSPRVRFSATGNQADGRVGIFADPVTEHGNTFHSYSVLTGSWSSVWTDNSQRLQANFTNPTSQVEVEIIGEGTNSMGRIDAFNSSGQLVARYTTPTLGNGQRVTMRVGRVENDIAYVIVGAQGTGRSIKIDNFRLGPKTTTKTGSKGQYRFENLPAGTYNVKARPSSSSYQLIAPAGGIQTVTLSNGLPSRNNNFAFQHITSPWQNPNFRFNVNADAITNSTDALVVINALNRIGGSIVLEGSGITAPPFVDVNGDGILNSMDALQVINFLNAQAGNGEGDDDSNNSGNNQSGSNSGSGSGAAAGNGSGASEGEYLDVSLTAQNPNAFAIPTGRLADILLLGKPIFVGPLQFRSYQPLSSPQNTQPKAGGNDIGLHAEEDEYECNHSLSTDLLLTDWDDYG